MGWLKKEGSGGFSKSSKYRFCVPENLTNTLTDSGTVTKSGTVTEKGTNTLPEKGRGKEQTNKQIKEKSKPKKKFTKPTRKHIEDYLQEKQQQMDIDYFIDYYESKNWMIGKNKMSNWKSAVNNWLRNEKKYKGDKNATHRNNQPKQTLFERREAAIARNLALANEYDEQIMGGNAKQVPDQLGFVDE